MALQYKSFKSFVRRRNETKIAYLTSETFATQRKRLRLMSRIQIRDAFDCIFLFLSYQLSPTRPSYRSPRMRPRRGGNRIPRICNYFESSRPTVGLTTRT